MSQQISKAWTFLSSNGTTRYQTLQYSDQSTSCECPGWTRRVAPDGSRSCKHTRAVEMGDVSEAVGHVDYRSHQVVAPAQVQKIKKSQSTFGQIGKRKMTL